MFIFQCTSFSFLNRERSLFYHFVFTLSTLFLNFFKLFLLSFLSFKNRSFRNTFFVFWPTKKLVTSMLKLIAKTLLIIYFLYNQSVRFVALDYDTTFFITCQHFFEIFLNFLHFIFYPYFHTHILNCFLPYSLFYNSQAQVTLCLSF